MGPPFSRPALRSNALSRASVSFKVEHEPTFEIASA
jgi:hypothetical protein